MTHNKGTQPGIDSEEYLAVANTLVALLDVVAAAPLSVAVAVGVFKAAVTLERILREKDQKVLTLNLAI